MIYLDNAASTPLYTEVIKKMQRSLLQDFANPSSNHKLGQLNAEKINAVKTLILEKLNGLYEYEVVFQYSPTRV